MADSTMTDAEKAEQKAVQDRTAAEEARLKIEAKEKTAEQKKADDAAAKADDSRAVAAAARVAETRTDPMTAGEARMIMAPDPGMSAGDHMAQKFGNDPANPKPAKDEHADPDLCTVRLTRITPDLPEPAVTMVHPEMVGDYLRSGWSR